MKIFQSCWSLLRLLQLMIMTGVSSRNNETMSSVSILSGQLFQFLREEIVFLALVNC